jgi:hypothetical protein
MMLNLILKPAKQVLIALLCFVFTQGYAQSVLHRNITINVDHQRLETVLKLMEQHGKFNFSYNSNLINKDSLVTMNASNETVKDALDQLLNYRFEYRESQNFVILRYAPSRLSLQMDKGMNEDNNYRISGFVVNEQTGQKLTNASVYERQTLESAITDRNGYFDLRIKKENRPVFITISKENYKDTTVTFLSEVTVNGNDGNTSTTSSSYSYLPDDLSRFENSGIVRFLTSSTQKIQSINLGGLITQQPFQASLVPGLGSHGSLSGQVVNKASLNVIGGYNAGSDGVELAGVFNLDRSDVSFFQFAGVFNVVGGSVDGLQIAGAFNTVQGNLKGVQLAFGFNHDGGVNGVQVAGLNIADKNSRGVQAGLMNIASKKFSGIQLGALFNYTQNLRGVQIGLINASDTSSGASIGLFNFVKHGYNRVIINANETVDANVLYKNGTPLLYNIWLVGTNVSDKKKLFEGGFGFGNQFNISSRLAINTEATSRYIYLGDADHLNLLNRLDIGLNIRLGRKFSIMAGPSLNYYYSDQKTAVNGYDFINDPSHYQLKSNKYFTRWYGWTVGITFL